MSNNSGGDPALPPIEERISFMIHRVNAQLARLCNPFFARYDLDLYSSRILVVLLEKDTVRVGELVDLMALPQSTISHQLRRLEKQGLIKRHRLQDDNRSVVVSLTQKGLVTGKECNVLSQTVFNAMIDGIPAEDLEVLKKHMTAMYDRLKSFDYSSIK